VLPYQSDDVAGGRVTGERSKFLVVRHTTSNR